MYPYNNYYSYFKNKQTKMFIVDRNNRDELNWVKTQICKNNKDYKKIVQLIEKFVNESVDNYRYGTSSIENWFSNNRLKKLNGLLASHNIKLE